jgi:hypothetical protein
MRAYMRTSLSTIKGSQCPWRGHLFMFLNFHFIQLSVCGHFNIIPRSDVEAEAEAPEAVELWWKRKRKHLKICRFSIRSVSKLLFKFW